MEEEEREAEEEEEEEEEGGGVDPPREVLARRQRRGAPGRPPGQAQGSRTAAGREQSGLRRPPSGPRRPGSHFLVAQFLPRGPRVKAARGKASQPPKKTSSRICSIEECERRSRDCSLSLRLAPYAPPHFSTSPSPFLFSLSPFSQARLLAPSLSFFPLCFLQKKRGGGGGEKKKEGKSQRKGANHAQYCLLRFIFLGRNFHLLSRAVSARLIAAIIPADK